MPQFKEIGDFIIDPDFNQWESICRTINSLRNAWNEQLACIDAINDPTLQLICMFSIIDCMAQEWASYPARDSKEVFCDFVLAHQNRYDYLDKVEPITLFYRVEDLIEDHVPLPGFPPEKEVNLESLGEIDSKTINSIITSGKAEEILKYIEKRKGAGFSAKKAHEHRLISLIYRMRSKATHEMTGLGIESSLHRVLNQPEPYYHNAGRIYVTGEKVVSDNIFKLIIPNEFIRNILIDCIEGYLAECLHQMREPFSNNKITRKYRLSWYDN